MSTQTEVLKNDVKSTTFLDALKQSLEQARIKNHLRYVEKSLRAVNVSHLSPELQAKRAENLDYLREYWQAGNFPKNIDFRFSFTPYFRDANGTLCAMAYLIDRSGYGNIVEAVVARNNFVYVENLTDGPVVEWVNANGLTQEEAALIQPTYYGWRTIQPDPVFSISIVEVMLWIVATAGLLLVEWAIYKLLPLSIQQKIGIFASKQAMATALVFNGVATLALFLMISRSARDSITYYILEALLLWIFGVFLLIFLFINYKVASWMVSTRGKRVFLCLYLSIICIPICYVLSTVVNEVIDLVKYDYFYGERWGLDVRFD